MKADRKPTKPIGRGKSKTRKPSPTHKAVKPKPHEKKTERKRVEEALHQAEIHYRALVEQTPAVIYTVDSRQPDFFVYISQQIEALSGYSPQAWIADAQLWNNLIHTEDRERVLAEEIRTNKTGESINIEYRLVHRDGHLVWVHEEARRLHDASGQPTVWQGFMLDITERKLAEEKIRQSEVRYRSLFEQTHDAVFIMDFMGNHISANQRAADMLGYTLAEIQKLTFRDISAEITQSENILKRLVAGEQIPLYERLFRKKNGQVFPVEINVELVRDSNGTPQYIQSVVGDITERKQAEEKRTIANQELAFQNEEKEKRAAELSTIVQNLKRKEEHLQTEVTEHKRTVEALRLSEQKFFILFEKSAFTILLSRLPDGVITNANEAFERAFGYTKQEVIGKTTLELGINPDEKGRARILAALKEHGSARDQELALHTKSGEMRFFSVNVDLMDIGDQKYILNTTQDITERKRAELETIRRVQNIQALQKIDQAIAGSLDLNLTLNVVLEQTKTELKVDAATVLLFNPHTQVLEFAAGIGFHSKAIERSRLRLGEGHGGRAALERRTVSVTNLLDAERSEQFVRAPLLADEGLITYFGTPLIAKGQVKGVLEVFHRSPFIPNQDWLDFLEVLAGQTAIAVDSASLFTDLQHSHTELFNAYDSTIEGWSHALDLRDKETEGHTLRVTEMTMKLARAAGITEEELVHVRRGALLHDIGKMGVPDHILLKPDKLTDEEWVAMRKHPTFAYELLLPIAYLRPALDIPYCHHEKWDGTGYPRGLKGEQIPLAARLFAIVDVWDALRSDRPYRQGWPKEKVIKHIKSLSGKHFDPKAVDLFLNMLVELSKDQAE